MKYPRCKHQNPSQAKFCLECGVRLALTCHKCRCDLPVGAKFCLECGEPVASRAGTESRFNHPTSGCRAQRTPRAECQPWLMLRCDSNPSMDSAG